MGRIRLDHLALSALVVWIAAEQGVGPLGAEEAARGKAPLIPPPPQRWWSTRWKCRKKVTLGRNVAAGSCAALRFSTGGWVEPDGGDVRIVVEDQKAIPCRILDAGREDSALVAFPIVDPKLNHAIYFGAPGTRAPRRRVDLRGGLLLEVRALGEGDCSTWDAMKKLVDASPEVLGRTTCRNIFMGLTPFGRATDHIAIYTGYLDIPESGAYTFATNSWDGSFLLVDGKVVAEFPGWHSPAGGDGREHKGEINLRKGLHGIEYYNAVGSRGQGHVAAIQTPQMKYLQPIPPNLFVPWAEATVGPMEYFLRSAPNFSWEITEDMGLEHRDIMAVRFTDASSVKGDDLVVGHEWDFGDGQVSRSRSPEHLYLARGIYTVSLTLKTSEGARISASQKVWVRPVHGRPRSFQGKLTRFCELSKGHRLKALSVPQLLNLAYIRRMAEEDSDFYQAVRATYEKNPPLDQDDLVHYGFLLAEHLVDDEANYREPVGIYRHISSRAPLRADRLRARVRLGAIHLHYLDDPKQAEGYLRAVRERPEGGDPDDLCDAAVLLADVHILRGESDKARALLDQAAKERRFSGDREMVLGDRSFRVDSYIHNKDFKTARDELRRWERDDPRVKLTGLSYLRWAELFLTEGRHREALRRVELLEKAAPESPSIARALLVAADCHDALGERKKALERYRRIIADFPERPERKDAEARLKERGEG